jgi:hypothetical protein
VSAIVSVVPDDIETPAVYGWGPIGAAAEEKLRTLPPTTVIVYAWSTGSVIKNDNAVLLAEPVK